MIAYDPDDTVRLVFKWRGTIWPSLMCRVLFWATLITYVTFFLINHNYPKNLPSVNRKVIAIPGALLSFMIVFFTSECYKRYSTGFNNCKRVGGAIRNITMSVKANFPNHPHLQQEVVRLCNLGQHVLFHQIKSDQYQRVGGTAEAEQFFTLEHACDELNWCTPAEKLELEAFAENTGCGELFVVCVIWAHDLLCGACKDGLCSEASMRTHAEQLFELRAAMSSIWSHFQCPMPLAYFHLLNFFCNIYLLVFSYALVFVDTWFCWISVLMYSVGIMGLREVSIMMVEPFGEDDSDINVKGMTLNTFKICHQLLVSRQPSAGRNSVEEMNANWEKAVAGFKGSSNKPDSKEINFIKGESETDYLLADTAAGGKIVVNT